MTPFGAPASVPTSTAPPKEHVPPLSQLHVVPEQLHAPLQLVSVDELAPPHPRGSATPRTITHSAPPNDMQAGRDMSHLLRVPLCSTIGGAG